MSIPASKLRQLVTPQSPDDAKRILEIACLAVASDGNLADEERAVLHALAGELKAYSPREVDGLVGQALDGKTREDRLDRLRALAGELSTQDAQHCAYKVSVVTALSDLAAQDEEFEFDLDIQEALELAPETAEKLTSEVNELLAVGE